MHNNSSSKAVMARSTFLTPKELGRRVRRWSSNLALRAGLKTVCNVWPNGSEESGRELIGYVNFQVNCPLMQIVAVIDTTKAHRGTSQVTFGECEV